MAAQIADKEPRIDILINNAGEVFAKRELTEDKFERTFYLITWPILSSQRDCASGS